MTASRFGVSGEEFAGLDDGKVGVLLATLPYPHKRRRYRLTALLSAVMEVGDAGD